MYAPRFFVSSQQKFGATDIKAPWRVTALRGQTVLQLLNQCYSSIYLDNSRKIHLRSVRAHGSKDAKRRSPHHVGERKRERKGEKRALAPLFICFSVPGPVLCKLGQPGKWFVLPEVLTPVLGPSFVLFLRAFPFQVF